LGDTYILNATASNAFHFTWTRERINRGAAANLPSFSDIGLNVAPSAGNFPQISVSGFFSTFCGTCSKATVYSGGKQFADDFNLIVGRNEISFGGEWIRRDLAYHTSTQQDPAYTFSGQITGYALADLLLGAPSAFTQGNLTQVNMIQNYFGFYAADKVRLSARISINLGLRWEPYFPEHDTQGRATHFDLPSYLAGKHTSVFQNAPPGAFFAGDSGFPEGGTNHHLANFAPRAGVVWDAGGDGRTVVRSGYGLLYDLPPMQIFDRFGFGPPWASAITINNPFGGFGNPYATYPGGDPFPQPVPPPMNAVFPSAAQYVSLPSKIRTTYFQQWNVSVQRQIASSWLFAANYLGNKGSHIWLNDQLDPAVYIPGVCGSSNCSTVGNTNSRRVLAQLNPIAGVAFSSLLTIDDGANSSYNAILLSVNHRLDHYFSVLANYTWSHCISDGDVASEISGSSYQDPYNRRGSRGNCSTDERQIFNLSLVAQAPKFSGSGALKYAASDWELSVIATDHTGLWFTPTTGVDSSLTGVGSDRPNVVANTNGADQSIARWFNTAAFVPNAPGTYGNAGRNSLQGPGGFGMDMALLRRIPIRETQRVEVRAEAFNLLNHPTFQNPSSSLSTSTFGRILGANDPRILQFALKYIF